MERTINSYESTTLSSQVRNNDVAPLIKPSRMCAVYSVVNYSHTIGLWDAAEALQAY